jgi:hypothetical protein
VAHLAGQVGVSPEAYFEGEWSERTQRHQRAQIREHRGFRPFRTDEEPTFLAWLKVPLCIHIAAHGNKDGLGFGKDLVKWDELFDTLRPLSKMANYDGDFILVISACHAVEQKLTSHFGEKARKASVRPPVYLFTTADEEPTFSDALVSWVVFYHQLPTVTLAEKDEVQKVLKRVKAAGGATLRYSRLDRNKGRYLHYTPSS